MKKAIFIIAIFLILLLNSGCLKEDTEAMTMTMGEFMYDYNQTEYNDTKTITSYLDSLDEGNTLIIKDTLDSVNFHEDENESITLISFIVKN